MGHGTRAGFCHANEERESEFADLQFVAGLQESVIDSSPIDVSAVKAASVTDAPSGSAPAEFSVPAADGHVVEENVRVRGTSDADDGFLQVVLGPLPGPTMHDKHTGTDW